ncbi:MAG TPA: hypothetical protein VNT81_04830 [Vicinamibacterales bacterium]|nr:hypothetical protein [Vicinamibacterales bacterium]
MNSPDTLALIRACMKQALKLNDEEAARIDDDSTPLDFAQWTSATHLELLLGIERETGVMFEADEMGGLASVKAIRASLEAKQAQ